MIELTVIKTSENPSVFTLSPSAIEIGGKDSSLIDKLHVNVPDEWKDKKVRVTFNQSVAYGGNQIPKFLDEFGTVDLKFDVTACSGDLVIDAAGVDYSEASSTGCHYTVYSHPEFGGTEQEVTQNEYNQFVAEVKGYSDSAQSNKTAAALSEQSSTNSAAAAKLSEDNAKASETASNDAKVAAQNSAELADESAKAAALSEQNSKASETSSAQSAINAANSAEVANGAKEVAAESATAAKLSADKAIAYTTTFQNPGYHNSIYRGKDISTNETDGSMYANIANGTFDDIFVGDYFTKVINGTNYVLQILGCDIKINRGDTALTRHHIVVAPVTSFGTYKMNDTNITDGGYVSSKMYTDTLPLWAGYLSTAFGSHLITSRELLTNATSSGSPSNWSWFDSKINLMTVEEVLGHGTFGLNTSGYPFNIGIAYGQLPLFRLSPDKICKRYTYWLRNITQPTTFSTVSSYGYVSAMPASYSFELQPYFLLG